MIIVATDVGVAGCTSENTRGMTVALRRFAEWFVGALSNVKSYRYSLLFRLFVPRGWVH